MAKNVKHTIVVEDGTQEVAIKNKFGTTICAVHFRPADFALLDRLEHLRQDFTEIVKPLSDIGINPDGTAEFEKDWEVMHSVETEMKRRFAEIFDMDDADTIFEKRHAFSIIGGEFFIMHLINALMEYIAAAMEEEAKLSKARIDKYLSQEARDAGQPTD